MIKTHEKIVIKESDLEEFLRESNKIEREYSEEAFENAMKAWKFLIYFDKITLPLLLESHRQLMIKLNRKIAGKIRKVNVRVGNSKLLNFSEINKKLDELFQRNPETEEEIKKWHIEFENIHPFEDGNGRIGRIIYNYQHVKNNLPLHIIHEGDEQYKYYEWFKINE